MRYSKILLAIVLISMLVFGSTMSAFADSHIYVLTVEVDAGSTGMGIVTGGGEYSVGDPVTVTATANPGHRFVKWLYMCSNKQYEMTGFSFTYTHDHDLTLRAVFEKTYNLTTGVNDVNMGTVTPGGTFGFSENVNMMATPKPGYKFVNWMVDFGDTGVFVNPGFGQNFTCNLSKCGQDYVPTVELIAHFALDPDAPTVLATIKYVNTSAVSIQPDTQVLLFTGPYTQTAPAISGYQHIYSSPSSVGTVVEDDDDFVITHVYQVPPTPQVITNTVTETVFVNVPATTAPTTAPATTEVITTEAVPLGAPAIVNFDEFVEEETMPDTEMVTDGEVVMEEEVPLADALPQTGQLSAEMFYGVGGLISGFGLWLKRRK